MRFKKTRGVVAAGNKYTAKAGKEILEKGGNAFDAAVACCFASFFAEGSLASAAGGGFLLAHLPSRQPVLFDFFVHTPLSTEPVRGEPEFFPVMFDFGEGQQEFHIGYGASAVPGCVKGLFHVQKQLGELPMLEVMEPAIRMAGEGVTINEAQAFGIKVVEPVISRHPEGKAIYFQNDTRIEAGDVLRNGFQASAFEVLAREGDREFYEGEMARSIVTESERFGGFLTYDDFLNYEVIERYPLTRGYRDWHLFTNPEPSIGGSLMFFMLELLEQNNLHELEFLGTEHVTQLAHAMKLCDDARRKSEDGNPNSESLNSAKVRMPSPGNTTHVSVIDEEGNAATVTTSLGQGSGHYIPNTGIIMNNMLGEADLFPNGFHKWEPNSRVPSNMAPSIMIRGRDNLVALGSGGANRIRSAIMQVISHLVDFEVPLDTAVNASRLHVEGTECDYEAGLPESAFKLIRKELQLETKRWENQNLFFGGVHVASLNSGQFSGAGDLRRGGVVLTN